MSRGKLFACVFALLGTGFIGANSDSMVNQTYGWERRIVLFPRLRENRIARREARAEAYGSCSGETASCSGATSCSGSSSCSGRASCSGATSCSGGYSTMCAACNQAAPCPQCAECAQCANCNDAATGKVQQAPAPPATQAAPAPPAKPADDATTSLNKFHQSYSLDKLPTVGWYVPANTNFSSGTRPLMVAMRD